MRVGQLIVFLGFTCATAFADEGAASANPAPAEPAIEQLVDAPAVVVTEDAPDRRWGVAFGLGLELRRRREINPEFGEFESGPQLFTTVRYGEFALHLEVARGADRRTRSGGFAVESSSWRTGAWARYAFREPGRYSPFVSLGGGASFERVRTSFGAHVDERRGVRRFASLGLGVSHVFWRYVLVEAETRLTSDEATRFPGVQFALRVGVSF